MATERHQIIRLISQLCHAEEETRRAARRQLVELGAEAVELLGVGLSALQPAQRPALVELLHEIGDARALLPLMRYVFDARGQPGAGESRGLAMQAIMDMTRPKDEARVFAFLVDMRQDADAFVRTYVVDCFARLGDPRALDYIREALSDPSVYVRERAQIAFGEVQKTQQIHPLELSEEDFLREFLAAEGTRLSELEALLPQHDDAFQLASTLVRQDAEHTMLGMAVLQRLGRPGARDVALRHFKLTRSDADRAASLRLMAEFIQADARPEEVRTIIQGLEHPDKFIQLAALEAAGRSGEPLLTLHAVRATRRDDSTMASAAAEGLSKVGEHLSCSLADELLKSLEIIRNRRCYDGHRDLIQCEAYLLRTLSRVLGPCDARARDAQQAALESLRESLELPAIIQTALEVLELLTPPSGLAPGERWHPGDAAAAVPLLSHASVSIQRRALEVIRRGAPGDTPNLYHQFERLMRADPQLVCDAVIPAILETHGPMARDQLSQLCQHHQGEIRRAARAALQEIRTRGASVDLMYQFSAGNLVDKFES